MVISSCQIIGYLAGIATLVGSITSTALPDWKHNNYAEESFGGETILRGLWASCNVRHNGAIQCKPIGDPFFVLPNVLRGCRTLAVLSSIMSFFGVAATPLGMQCTRIGGDRVTKSRLARFGGLLFGVSGILIGTSVSWFADDIAKEFNKPPKTDIFNTISDIKFVYGSSLFIGWASMIMGIISAIFLFLGSSEGGGTPRTSPSLLTSLYENRSATANTAPKDRARSTTPTKGFQAVKPFNNYFATAVTSNGSHGAFATTALVTPQSGDKQVTRQASVTRTGPKTNSIRQLKTYV